MRFQSKLAGLSILLASALLPVQSAFATGAAIVVGYNGGGAAQFQQMTASVVTTTATNPIIQAFSQVTDGLKNVLVQSNAEIATQAERRQVEAIKKERAAKAQDEQQPAQDACGDQTVAAYAESVVDVTKAISSQYKAAGRARSGGAPPRAEQAMLAEKRHADLYCDPATAPGGKCERGAKKDRVTGQPLKSADTSADSLFKGAGDDKHHGNLTYTPDQIAAARAFIANVIDQTDAPRKPTLPESKTVEGKQYEGLRQVYLARVSMAESALSDVLALRTPTPSSRVILDEIGRGAPAGGVAMINERKKKVRAYSPSGDISPLELMDIEVARRADNPEWYAAVNTKLNDTALLREQTFMLAMMLKMQYQKFRADEVSASLAAQQAVELAKSGMRDKLSAAEQAMLRGVSK